MRHAAAEAPLPVPARPGNATAYPAARSALPCGRSVHSDTPRLRRGDAGATPAGRSARHRTVRSPAAPPQRRPTPATGEPLNTPMAPAHRDHAPTADTFRWNLTPTLQHKRQATDRARAYAHAEADDG